MSLDINKKHEADSLDLIKFIRHRVNVRNTFKVKLHTNIINHYPKPKVRAHDKPSSGIPTIIQHW